MAGLQSDPAIFIGKVTGCYHRLPAIEPQVFHYLRHQFCTNCINLQPYFLDKNHMAVDAVERISSTFKLILMDIPMPEKNRLDAAQCIHHISPDLPVSGQTGDAQARQDAKCRNAEIVAAISQPINAEELLATGQKSAFHAEVMQENASAAPPNSQLSDEGTAISVIDWLALNQRFNHREAFIAKLVATSLQANAKVADQLRNLAAAGDIEQIGQIAHALKGVAGNMFARDLGESALRTMSSSRIRHPSALSDALDLANALDRFIVALKRSKA